MTDFLYLLVSIWKKAPEGGPLRRFGFLFFTEFNNVEQIQRFLAGGWQQDGIRPLQQSHLPLQASPHSHDPFVTIRTTASAKAMAIKTRRIQEAIFMAISPKNDFVFYPFDPDEPDGAGRMTAQMTPKISRIATIGPTPSTD